MEVIAQRAPPTSNDRLPLQDRHSLTPTRRMGDREEPPPKPPMDPEWCPYVDVSVVVKLFDHRGGSQRSLFLCLAKLRADHHCVPDHGQSLPAVSEHCLRRTSWRTWEKPRVGALIRATPPAQSPSPEAVGSPRLFVPPTARDSHTTGPRLQHLNMIRNPRSPGPQDYRAPRRRSSSERELRDISLDPSRAPTYWLRVDPGPHACYLYGRKRFLECARTMRGSRPHEKKLEASDSASPVSTLSLSARGRIIQETLPLVTPIPCCSSVIIVTLCPRLTSVPDPNKATVPPNPMGESDKIRMISTCCCPQCSLGPDDPEGDLPCYVLRCPQCESPPLAWKGNHPCLGGLLIVWICAAPSSERFTGAPLAPRLNQPTAVLGTIVSIFPRKMDPPCVPEVERENPTQRASRLRATKSEGGPPVRRSGPFCTAASGDRMIPVGRPLSVIPRAFPSVGGAAVRVRIPLCECDLVRRISVRVRRLNQSWTTGTKGVIPTRKMIQPCTAGATGAEEVVPIRRVEQLGTAGAAGSEEVVPSRRVTDRVPLHVPPSGKESAGIPSSSVFPSGQRAEV